MWGAEGPVTVVSWEIRDGVAPCAYLHGWGRLPSTDQDGLQCLSKTHHAHLAGMPMGTRG